MISYWITEGAAVTEGKAQSVVYSLLCFLPPSWILAWSFTTVMGPARLPWFTHCGRILIPTSLWVWPVFLHKLLAGTILRHVYPCPVACIPPYLAPIPNPVQETAFPPSLLESMSVKSLLGLFFSVYIKLLPLSYHPFLNTPFPCLFKNCCLEFPLYLPKPWLMYMLF